MLKVNEVTGTSDARMVIDIAETLEFSASLGTLEAQRLSIAPPKGKYAQLLRVFLPEEPGPSMLPSTIKLRVGLHESVDIGRSHMNDICLSDMWLTNSVSEKHAKISLSAEGWHFITDLESENGLYINNVKLGVGAYRLRHRDIIGFGGPAETELRNVVLMNCCEYQYWQPPNDASRDARYRARGCSKRAKSDAPRDELEDLECAVCYDFFEDPVDTGVCDHTFCRACLELCVPKRVGKCPLCRLRVDRPFASCAVTLKLMDMFLEDNVPTRE